MPFRTGTEPPGAFGSGRTALACLLILAAVATVFYPLAGAEFINYDDNVYIMDNPRISTGLSWHNITWAFTTAHFFYFPITLMSHMLDYSIFGAWAGGHHITSVAIHALSSCLLFLALLKMTRDGWPSLFASLLFAIHPMHVEAVAWVSERKELLSSLFFMLTLLAYVRYTRRESVWRYSLVFLSLLCGLMSKSMVVSTPLILLFLDYWPLGRIASKESLWRKALEKMPLFMLSAAFSVITYLAQARAGAVVAAVHCSMWERVANASVSYANYIGRLFFPVGMCILYPLAPKNLPVWQVCAGLLLLVLATVFAVKISRAMPFLVCGWLWFLVSLVPVIGLVQVGGQGFADRYTYLPYTGLFIALCWFLASTVRMRPRLLKPVAFACLAWLLLLGYLARRQVLTWHNSATVWYQALMVSKDNAIACNSFGHALVVAGKLDEAIPFFEESMRIKPLYVDPYVNLGFVYLKRFELKKAEEILIRALEIQRDSYWGNLNLGITLYLMNRTQDALAYFRRALEIKPGAWDSNCYIGLAEAELGEPVEAMRRFRLAEATSPDSHLVHFCLGVGHEQAGEIKEAEREYRKALAAMHKSAEALDALARLLLRAAPQSSEATSEALASAEAACQITMRRDPRYLTTLAVALARSGYLDKAAAAGQEAMSICRNEGMEHLAPKISHELDEAGILQPAKAEETCARD